MTVPEGLRARTRVGGGLASSCQTPEGRLKRSWNCTLLRGARGPRGHPPDLPPCPCPAAGEQSRVSSGVLSALGGDSA